MELLVFVLVCYGITNIVCFGRIFAPVRAGVDRLKVEVLSEFVRCPMCVGFWVGLAVSLAGYGVVHPFLDGCMGSGASFLLHAASVYLCEDC